MSEKILSVEQIDELLVPFCHDGDRPEAVSAIYNSLINHELTNCYDSKLYALEQRVEELEHDLDDALPEPVLSKSLSIEQIGEAFRGAYKDDPLRSFEPGFMAIHDALPEQVSVDRLEVILESAHIDNMDDIGGHKESTLTALAKAIQPYTNAAMAERIKELEEERSHLLKDLSYQHQCVITERETIRTLTVQLQRMAEDQHAMADELSKGSPYISCVNTVRHFLANKKQEDYTIDGHTAIEWAQMYSAAIKQKPETGDMLSFMEWEKDCGNRTWEEDFKLARQGMIALPPESEWPEWSNGIVVAHLSEDNTEYKNLMTIPRTKPQPIKMTKAEALERLAGVMGKPVEIE